MVSGAQHRTWLAFVVLEDMREALQCVTPFRFPFRCECVTHSRSHMVRVGNESEWVGREGINIGEVLVGFVRQYMNVSK